MSNREMKSKIGSVLIVQNPVSLLQKLSASKICLQAHSNENSWATGQTTSSKMRGLLKHTVI